VPSGIDADTGESTGSGDDDVVRVEADRVVTFHDEKPGLTALDADVTVADIGIPAAAERFTGPGDLLGIARDPNSQGRERRGARDRRRPVHRRTLAFGPIGPPDRRRPRARRLPGDRRKDGSGLPADLIVRGLPGNRIGPAHVDRALELAAGNDVVVLGRGSATATA